MVRPKANTKASQQDEPTSSSPDTLLEEIWAKLEIKLNGWIEHTIPGIVREIVKAQAVTVLDAHVSSPEFNKSISESLQFDIDELKASQRTITKLEESKQELKDQIDDLEQYTRRTNIRIYGIPETEEVDTDNLAINFVHNELGIQISANDISRSHRIGKRSSKPRPIIVRLTRHNTKVAILRNRRQLKLNKRPFNVQEDLTMPRRDILKYLNQIEEGVVDKVWNIDGIICLRPTKHTSTIERCTTMEKCREIVRKYK